MRVELKIELKNIKFWNQPAWVESLICDLEDDVRERIEEKVIDWLKDDKGDPTLEFGYLGKYEKNISSFMVWHRAEMYVKECMNVWSVWRMATCSGYKKMLSYKVKEIGTNEIIKNKEFKMPNEIRYQSGNYQLSFGG
jgi:hypothetical protein